MQHAIRRHNVWFAVLTVPQDLRGTIGRVRFSQTTKTGIDAKAAPRVAALVGRWKDQIEKARGGLPDPKATFWEGLRHDLTDAKNRGDEGTESAIVDLAEQMARKLPDREEGSLMYRIATGQAPALIPLAPLVEKWKASLRLAQKTIDQQHRDVSKMADHFKHLAALTPQKVKEWTDKLIESGTTTSSFGRIANGCHSFWLYLQESGTKAMIDPNPFIGPFRLALRTAVTRKVKRAGFAADELSRVYAEALRQRDQPLADLIALGAYTGGRIEELCNLTTVTAKGGFLHMGTKTEASVRDCPIHPAVAPLVARLIAASIDGFLIPSTADNQYATRSKPHSQKFGRLKKRMGFGPEHVFHSTRHTLVTLMHQAGVRSEVIADVVGHEKGNFTLDTYGSGSSMAQKLEAISKVSYPGALGAP